MRSDSLTLEECKSILKRIAWNIQYRVKTIRRKEMQMIDGIFSSQAYDNDLTELYINEILDNLKSEKNRTIVRRVVIDGYTETEVAKELNMTQQGVHKCKVASLKKLKESTKSIVC